MKEYLTLTAEKFHLRTAHSILHGYWTVELGGVNQVVHLWEYGNTFKTISQSVSFCFCLYSSRKFNPYALRFVNILDSYDHRAGVRAKLASDADWISQYFGKILPWFQKQDNMTLTTLPNMKNVIYPENKGAYYLKFRVCIMF